MGKARACAEGAAWGGCMFKRCVFPLCVCVCKQQSAPSAPRAFLRISAKYERYANSCSSRPGSSLCFLASANCARLFLNLGFLESFFHRNCLQGIRARRQMCSYYRGAPLNNQSHPLSNNVDGVNAIFHAMKGRKKR